MEEVAAHSNRESAIQGLAEAVTRLCEAKLGLGLGTLKSHSVSRRTCKAEMPYRKQSQRFSDKKSTLERY